MVERQVEYCSTGNIDRLGPESQQEPAWPVLLAMPKRQHSRPLIQPSRKADQQKLFQRRIT